MPVPSAITDLSTTAASNSPAGSDNVFPDLDNYLRAQASFIALLRDGRGLSTEVSVASATTTDIGGASSMQVQITGTTTITSFGTNYLPRILRFAGALTLTHNATTLILPTGANLTTAAGDMCLVVPVGTSGWRVMQYQRAANGSAPFLQAGSGAVTTTLQAKLQDTISVKDFGATGDGTTDDRTAVFNALTAGKGKTVYFPAGTYLLNSSITLDSTFSNTKIYGDGTGSILKLGASATEATFLIRSAAYIYFENIKFDGNSSAQSSLQARAVKIERDSNNISFFNTVFYNNYSDNVALFYVSGYSAIKNVSFTNCTFDTVTTSTRANLQLWNTENITVKGCYFTNWGYDAIAVNFFSPAVNGGLIVDSCYFENTNSDFFAIEFVPNGGAGGAREYRIKNVNITNNVFDANNKSTLGASGISGWADYVSVVGNTWRRSNSGSWRQGIEAAGSYWNITGNVLDDSAIVCSSTAGTADGYNYIVSGNSVKINGGSEQYAIRIGGTGVFNRTVIANNIVELVGIAGPNSGAINVGTYGSAAQLNTALITNNICSHDSVVADVVGMRLDMATGSNNVTINQNYLTNFGVGINNPTTGAVVTDATISNNTFRNCTTNYVISLTLTSRIYNNTYNASYELVSADRGNASVTVVAGVDAPTQVFSTPLTTNRTVTLSSTNAFAGESFRVVRTAAATGAFTLSLGGLKTLNAGEWGDVQYSGSAWFLAGFGTL